MADDVQITAGSGTIVATDEVAGTRHVQLMKLALGADGALDNLVDAGQQAMAASVPVVVASDQSAIPVSDASGSLTVDNAALSVTGGGVEATALRVTLASDSTGVLSVDDNGGALTVDGTVTANLAAGTNNIGDVDVLSLPATPAGDNAIGRVKITDGTDVADVLDLTNANPLTVAILDGNGDQITSFGGGTQYTEDAAAAANPVGTVPILVRTDTPATQVSADGDNIAQRGTNYGAAFVQVVSSSGTLIDSFGGSAGVVSALHVVAAASDNAASVKGSAGTLRGLAFYNNTTYPIYVKFHNTAGVPTAGTGVVRAFGIQAGTQRDILIPGGGISFSTGIGVTIIKDLADNGTTATALNDAVGEIWYE